MNNSVIIRVKTRLVIGEINFHKYFKFDRHNLKNERMKKQNKNTVPMFHGLDTYDYGARQYDPILGRWDRMDPLCEKYYDLNTTFLNTWATRITPVMILPYWS